VGVGVGVGVVGVLELPHAAVATVKSTTSVIRHMFINPPR
jgi:hypothetical protein